MRFPEPTVIQHKEVCDQLLKKYIRNRLVGYGGNMKLKIYGTLHCSSGKRMKKENRVFFQNISDAIENGYRPCGNCMREAYKNWSNGIVR